MKNKTHIVSIQEHRTYHADKTMQYTSINNYQVVTSSAAKNPQGSTIGGIGLLLSPKASDNLLKERINDHILITEFNSNPKITAIAFYSDENSSDENEADIS